MTTHAVWGGDQLDLEAYLARIGYEGDRRPTLETLRALHAAHLSSIGFENLEIVVGRPVLLDLESLQAKMVEQRRGGYCYEQNLLYAAALDRLGFRISGLCARPRMGDRRIRPATHALLMVELDGEDWITDVGFGAEGLLEPLPLRDGVESHQGEWTFGLVHEKATETEVEKGKGRGRERGPEVWVLRTRHADDWFDLYAFGTERRFPADYAVFNHYISTHPRSPFTGQLVVQRASHDLRRTLIGREYAVTRPDGTRETREVSPQELPDLLATEFGITLSAADARALVTFHER